jgi:hypothetical protein
MNGGETIWAIRRVMMLHEDTEGTNYSWRGERPKCRSRTYRGSMSYHLTPRCLL